MSKKKKYFLGDELSIIESSSDKSVNLNETLASKSNEQKCKRYSRKPLFGMVLRRPFINKQSSNVCCIEELEDRCLIKIPKKKVSNDDKLSVQKHLTTLLIQFVKSQQYRNVK